MTEHALTVELEDRVIAELTTSSKQIAIDFADEYRADYSATPLSVSMPRNRRHHVDTTPSAWLWGLLPDNEDVLRRWVADYGASLASPASFLATEIGLDCAGAVRFYPTRSDTSVARDSGVRTLTLDDVANRLEDLDRDATRWLDGQTAGQFSLAGAQAKLALRCDGPNDQWGHPYGNETSTHILKPAVPDFAYQHVNEHLCLTAAANLGLSAAATDIVSFGSHEVLKVERFDRYRDQAGQWRRIHQEDMCQALGVHPAQKYENDGGPTASNIAELITTATGRSVAERETKRFTDALIFNWIIAGTDAHAKNYGLLHSGSQTRVAPLYDISSFLPYDDSKGHKVKLAMKIGGEYKIKQIGHKAWTRFAEEIGLDESIVLDRCEELATNAPRAFAVAAGVTTAPGPMPEQLTDLVTRAAQDRLDSLIRGHTAMPQTPAKFALDLADAIPFDDLPHADTLSVRLQLLVEPPGEADYFYYQFIVARWPRSTLEHHPDKDEPTFWNRVASTATAAAREWLRSDQPGRSPNVVDAVVLPMTNVRDEPGSSQAKTFTAGERVDEWEDPADLIRRADAELRRI